MLYVLDEPSIGLHQRDNRRLIETLTRLRDLGNTLIVVEHDEDTIAHSDWVVDIGPAAGEHGGQVVHSGTYAELLRNPNSITGAYLSGKLSIDVPAIRRPVDRRKQLTVIGAREHNLRDIDVAFPLGVLTSVTGVSGSGKSTLVNDILASVLANKLNGARQVPGRHTRINGLDHLDKLVRVDQSPIGRTPRSNPATYTGVFDKIRTLFAATTEAKVRGYQPGRFSFNVKGGRCEACSGDGTIKIEMNFLPDVYVPCEVCHGARYNRETLEVHYKGKTISEVLDMSIEEAAEFFEPITGIHRYLRTLVDVGLGYVRLGQPAPTLSGGEAQRVKLAAELQKRSTGRTVYILDEPTTGLHFEDIRKLLKVINGLVDKGNSVIVIEHNLDVIKTSDWIVDMGPEGGSGGGTVVAQGTPEDVAAVPESYTGKFLADVLVRTRTQADHPGAAAAQGQLALDRRPDGDVADLDITRLLDREGDCPGDRFGRQAEALHGRAGAATGLGVVDRGVQFGVDVSGGDGRGADDAVGGFLTQRLQQGAHGVLGGRVDAHVRDDLEAGGGHHRDEIAVALPVEDRHAAAMPCSTPRRLTSIIADQPSTSRSVVGPILLMPALPTNTSRRPNSCTAASTSRSTSARCVTSVATVSARAARVTNLVGQLAQPILAARTEDDGRATPGQQPRGRGADTAAGAGDRDDRPGQG